MIICPQKIKTNGPKLTKGNKMTTFKPWNPTPEFVLVLFITFVLTCLCYCAPHYDVTSNSTATSTVTETPVTQTVTQVACFHRGKLILHFTTSNLIDMDHNNEVSCNVR